MKKLYLEDMHEGQVFRSEPMQISAEDIKNFATQFDPQPFHLDDIAAKDTVFKGLAASGWHTAAISMRLVVNSEFRPAGGIIGAGVEKLSWKQPVRPDDILTAETEIISLRLSKSNPQKGVIKVSVTTFNQHQDVVQHWLANLIVASNKAEQT